MNTMKSLFAASLLAIASSSAMAQATYTDQNGDEYTFNKHWFLDLQGGAQYTLGEAKFGDLLSPNVQLGLGYQFSPVFGMRLQANGWQSKGGWAGFRAQKGETPYNAQYKYKYVAPGVDFMFNLSNLFCGWNPNRVLNVTAFAGAGSGSTGFSFLVALLPRLMRRPAKALKYQSGLSAFFELYLSEMTLALPSIIRLTDLLTLNANSIPARP